MFTVKQKNFTFMIKDNDFENIIVTKTIKNVERLHVSKIHYNLEFENKAIILNHLDEGFYKLFALDDLENPFLTFVVKHEKEKIFVKILQTSIPVVEY